MLLQICIMNVFIMHTYVSVLLIDSESTFRVTVLGVIVLMSACSRLRPIAQAVRLRKHQSAAISV